MKDNDIDNVSPDTVLVHVSCVMDRVLKPGRFKKTKPVFTQNLLATNWCWQYAQNHGVILVLFSYGTEDWPFVPALEFNPFAAIRVYESPQELATHLAYRPDVRGVIDPGHPGMFGFRSMDAKDVIRGG